MYHTIPLEFIVRSRLIFSFLLTGTVTKHLELIGEYPNPMVKCKLKAVLSKEIR